ncbi:hypothetical protein VTO42DRAFT_2427 [Malbranchea cinnamomea]
MDCNPDCISASLVYPHCMHGRLGERFSCVSPDSGKLRVLKIVRRYGDTFLFINFVEAKILSPSSNSYDRIELDTYAPFQR